MERTHKDVEKEVSKFAHDEILTVVKTTVDQNNAEKHYETAE